MANFRLGLSACSKPFTDEAFNEYAKANIKCIEISGKNETIENLDWKGVELRSNMYGVELWSLHLPLSWPAWLHLPSSAHTERILRHMSSFRVTLE